MRKKEYVLEQPYPNNLPEVANVAARRAYKKHCNDSLEVSCLMLAIISSDLQKHYENANCVRCLGTRRGLRDTTSLVPCLRAS